MHRVYRGLQANQTRFLIPALDFKFTALRILTMNRLVFSLSLIALTLIIGCKSEQEQVSNTHEAAEAPQEPKELGTLLSYAIVPDSSYVSWACSKPGKTHTGVIPVSNGKAVMEGGELYEGRAKMNMAGLEVTDLKGESKLELEAHLKGTQAGGENDFFNVTQYPEADFNISRIVKLTNDPNYNVLIYGVLHIKDVGREIAFKANFTHVAPHIRLQSEEFVINRTDWGINFMSKKLFPQLKDKFIEDEVRLQVNMLASGTF